MNNFNFDTIVIGGGLGGLTTGATLAKKGKKVLLLEQHYIPGGCATTFKRKDFVMEVGLHEMDGLCEKDVKQECFDFLEVNKNVTFIQIPELFKAIYKNGEFIQPHGYADAMEALIKKFPHEKKAIKKLLKFMKDLFYEIPKFPVERWKQICVLPIVPLLFPNVFRASNTTIGKWMDKHIKDEELKLVLQTNLLYYGDDPHKTSMMYFSVAQAGYILGGGHFIKGGSQKLSNYLKKVIEENEGQVLLGKKALEILVEKGKANGVVFKDAFNDKAPPKKVFADTVVANAAVPLVKDLLPSPYAEKIQSKIEGLEIACSLLTIYIGFKTNLKKMGNKHYSTFISGSDVTTLKDVAKNNKGDWRNKGFVFVDYSQIDSHLAPSHKSVGVICAADYLADWSYLSPEAYADKKRAVAEILFNRLEKQIKGIKNQIEYYEVGTSKTVQRYTLNPKGTAYGFAQTPKQSGIGRIPLKSPVPNLYFAGAWTFPGGGFTGAIISGYLAAQMLEKNHPKKIENPTYLPEENIVKLLDKKIIAENTLMFSLDKPKGLHYEAGQYAVVEILYQKEGKTPDMNIRPLSMVSHPDENVLKFAVRLSDSPYKKALHKSCKNDLFRVFAPLGKFKLTTKNKGIVFLISGIGVTPVLPFLKALEKDKFKHPIYLFYTNKNEKTTAYHENFKAIKMQNFHYKPIFSETQKRLDITQIENEIRVLQNFDYYIVGTTGFIRAMKTALLSKGVDKTTLKIDDFGG